MIDSDALMEECVRMMQQTLRAAPSVKKRAKSVYSQRNLGTIKDRKREKKQQEKEVDNGEIIMRILRMRCVSPFDIIVRCCHNSGYCLLMMMLVFSRPGASDFIAQQMQIMSTMQAEQEQREREKKNRKLSRPGGASQIPAVPPVPEIPAP